MKQTGISEKEFRQQILDLARVMGWHVYFTWNSLHSPSGFPDLVMVRSRRQIFAELKAEKGKLTEAQTEWIKTLTEVPTNEVYIWKPSNWEDIVQIMERNT